VIFLANRSDDRVPTKTVDPEEVGDCIERRANCSCQIDEFEGFEIEFAEGSGLRWFASWKRRAECGRIGEDTRRRV